MDAVELADAVVMKVGELLREREVMSGELKMRRARSVEQDKGYVRMYRAVVQSGGEQMTEAVRQEHMLKVR